MLSVRKVLLLLLSIVSLTTAFPSLPPNNCKKLFTNWSLYTNQTLMCVSQGQVLFYPKFTCHSLHSQDPCEAGGRLVFSASPCAQTVCRAYTDQSDQSCLYPTISHHGQCVDPADAAACGNILGRRLVPDLFGDYTCQCDREIGFVDFNGSCHAEFLQGPCQKGEQVLLGEEGVECVKNICDEGEVVWSDGDCYLYNSVGKLPFREYLTREENKYLAQYNHTLNDVVTTFNGCVATFTNCCKTDDRGKCLKEVDLPKVAELKEEDWQRLITEQFPDIIGENTAWTSVTAVTTLTNVTTVT